MNRITKEIEEIVINRYKNGETCRQIGKSLNFAHATIASILKNNKIDVKLYNRFIIPEDLHKEIISSYQNKTLNTYELATKYNVSYTAVRNLLLHYNIPMRSKSERMRQYQYDENYFNIIDTQDKAYFLGLLYADGCNSGTSMVINLHKKDKHILEEMIKYIGYSGKLYERTKKNQFVFSLSSMKLVEQLNKLGCVRNKSLILKFPSYQIVPDKLLSHFIRGYMDGDGCVAIDKRNNQGIISFIGSYDFIDSLQEFFIKQFDIRGYKRTKNKVKELIIGGQQQSLKILNWLYNDSSIYLNRKYDKYLKIKNRDLNG